MCCGVDTLDNISEHNLEQLNKCLEKLSLKELLIWCLSLPNIGQVTSFGSSGMVIIHEIFDILKMNEDISSSFPIIFIDTLHHFSETIEFVERVEDRYDIHSNLYRYKCAFANTRESFEKYVDDKQLWLSNPLIYDQLVKVEPLQRALNELNIKIWITGRRR